MSDPKTPTKTATPDAKAAEAAPSLSNAEIAKKIDAKVLDLVSPKKGEPAEPAMVPIKAEHILSHRVDGEDLHVVTTDGQKHKVAV